MWKELSRTSEIVEKQYDIFDEEGNVIDTYFREEETVITEIEFNLNGNIKVLNVFHFMPNNEEEIISNINNRYKFELNRI
jgi:hypothetical protein